MKARIERWRCESSEFRDPFELVPLGHPTAEGLKAAVGRESAQLAQELQRASEF
jgi:hypothetical protein